MAIMIMNILGKQHEIIKVGKLEIMKSNFHYSKQAIYKRNGECYFDFSATWKIDELLRKEGTGFRVFTKKDFACLAGLGSRWVNCGEAGNNIAGYFFGERAHKITTIDDPKGCVFFPACGLYSSNENKLIGQNDFAYYWSSSTFCDNSAYILYFHGNSIYPGTVNFNKNYGLSVRCVRDLV